MHSTAKEGRCPRRRDITQGQFQARLMTLPRGVLNNFGLLLHIPLAVVSAPTKAIAVTHIVSKVSAMIAAQKRNGGIAMNSQQLTYEQAWNSARTLHQDM